MWVKALELEPDWIQVQCGMLPLARHSPGDSDDDYDDDDYDDDDYDDDDDDDTRLKILDFRNKLTPNFVPNKFYKIYVMSEFPEMLLLYLLLILSVI